MLYLPKSALPIIPARIINIIANITRFIKAFEINVSGCTSLPTRSLVPFLKKIIFALLLWVIISEPSIRLISKLIKPSLSSFSSGHEFRFPASLLYN